MEVLNEVLAQYGSLTGVMAVVVLLVQVAKHLGLPDGQAANLSAGLNLIGVAALLAFRVFNPSFDVAGADAQALNFANVANVVFAYFLSLGGSKLLYQGLKGVTGLGKSNSA